MAQDVSLRISAADQTGPAFESAERRVQRFAASSDRSGHSLTSFGQAARGAGSAISQVVSLQAALEIRQISSQQATERLSHAQREYANAVADHGAGSARAADALRQVEAAQANLEKTQVRGNFATVAAVAQVAALTAQAPAAIRALQGIATASGLAARGMSAFHVAATGGLAAVGIVAGLALVEGAYLRIAPAAGEAQSRVSQLTAEIDLQRRVIEGAKDIRLPVGLQPVGLSDIEALKETMRGLPGIGDWFGETLDEKGSAALAEHSSGLADFQGRVDAFAAAQQRTAVLLDAAAVDQRLFKIGRSVQDLVKAGDVAGLTALRDTLFSKLGTASGGDYKGFADAVTIANSALNSLATGGGRAAIDSIAEAAEKLNAFKDAAMDMSEVGVNLLGFSKSFRDEMGKLAKTVSEAGGSEDDFNAAALKTSKAMRDQAAVTKFKDETTEQFIERLRTLGFTESDLAGRLDLTTGKLHSQADASRQAASAMGGPGQESASGSVDLSARVEREHQVRIAAGAGWVDVFASQLPELMKDSRFAHSVGMPPAASKAEQWDRAEAARMAQATKEEGWARTAASMGLKKSGSSWTAMAEGGIVTRPMRALIGEAGPEAVIPLDQMRGGLGGGGSFSVEVVQHFHGNASAPEVRAAAQAGVMDAVEQARRRNVRLDILAGRSTI